MRGQPGIYYHIPVPYCAVWCKSPTQLKTQIIVDFEILLSNPQILIEAIALLVSFTTNVIIEEPH